MCELISAKTMLMIRSQRLLNVHECARLVRLYFTGNNVRSNLRLPIDLLVKSRDQCFSSMKSLIPVCNRRKWFVDMEKRYLIFSRLCHTKTNDDAIGQRITENNHARAILSRRGVKSIAPPFEPIENVSDEEAERILSNDWKNSSPKEILQAFESLSCHAKLNSLSLNQEKQQGILQALNDKLGQLEDDEFLRVFACLTLWKGIFWTTNIQAHRSLWMELDRECIRRLANWNSQEALLACDYWQQIGLAKKINFVMTVLKKLGRKPRQLTPDNFLAFMFMINICRKPPVNMYEVEYRFDNIFNEFTANELGVIAMGFFKSKTPFRDDNIVQKILYKMIEEMDSVEEISVSAIMKITRYSISLKELKSLKKALRALISRVGDFSIPCLTNILQTAASVQCCEPEVMRLIVEKFEKNIDKARLKDIERFSWALGIFDYHSESRVYEKILASLRDRNRRKEMESFPAVTATALAHLSYAKIFPTELIKKHFDPTFLQQTYDNNPYKIGYNFFTLESNLRIDMPEYEGPFLKPSIRDFHAKKYLWVHNQSHEKISPSDKFILEVAHICKLALKSKTSIHVDQVLPHYVKPDIIACFDETNNPIDPQPILSEITAGTIKYPPQMEKNLKWIAIVLATQNQMITGTNRLVGPFKCKLRQLEKIGYSPIVVPFIDWYNLPDLNAKQEYLTKKLCLPTEQSMAAAVI